MQALRLLRNITSNHIIRCCSARLVKVDNHLLLETGVRSLRHDAVHVRLPLQPYVIRSPVSL